MTPDHSQSSPLGPLVGSARTARLYGRAVGSGPAGATALILPSLECDPPSDRFATAAQLFTAFGHGTRRNVCHLQWDRHWCRGGGERFSPLVRDLDRVVTGGLPDTSGPVHLVALGSGALVALKWFTHRQREKQPAPALSLSLIAPALSVAGRRPRTSLAHVTCPVFLAVDHANRGASQMDVHMLATRLPDRPHLVVAQPGTRYLEPHPPSAAAMHSAASGVTLAGSWRHRWADWLAQREGRAAAVDTRSAPGAKAIRL